MDKPCLLICTTLVNNFRKSLSYKRCAFLATTTPKCSETIKGSRQHLFWWTGQGLRPALEPQKLSTTLLRPHLKKCTTDYSWNWVSNKHVTKTSTQIWRIEHAVRIIYCGRVVGLLYFALHSKCNCLPRQTTIQWHLKLTRSLDFFVTEKVFCYHLSEQWKKAG